MGSPAWRATSERALGGSLSQTSARGVVRTARASNSRARRPLDTIHVADITRASFCDITGNDPRSGARVVLTRLMSATSGRRSGRPKPASAPPRRRFCHLALRRRLTARSDSQAGQIGRHPRLSTLGRADRGRATGHSEPPPWLPAATWIPARIGSSGRTAARAGAGRLSSTERGPGPSLSRPILTVP